MEERKIDINSIIGFVLIFLILIWMLYQNSPTPEEVEAQEKAKQEQIDQEPEKVNQTDTITTTPQDYNAAVEVSDSLKLIGLQNQLGAFAYSASRASSSDGFTEIENEQLQLKVSNKGGFITEVKLKEFIDHDSVPIFLVRDQNVDFNINFATTDNRILNTKDLIFEPHLSNSGDNQILSMRLKVSEDRYLEYRYELRPDDYLIGFAIRSQGLSNVVNSSRDINLDWQMQGFRHAKSISYENRYTRLTYRYDGRIDKLSQMSDDDEIENNVEWISFRQHFFSSILVPDQAFSSVEMKSFDLVQDEDVDSLFTKRFEAKVPLVLNGGEFNSNMNMYYGPTDHRVLKQYEKNLEESIPFGWGIFGWINKSIFIPLFSFLSSVFPYGIAIIIMTIVVRIVLSPVLYKSYLSQAKMRILKPEITELNEKYKDNPMKRQQETMALYSKAGASPLSGCLPAVLQLPVFYALFMFFPTAFDLRQKSFLWAEDLSSYDTIAELPFRIPFYGDHVSLFPILAAIAIFFYMKMTTGQQVTAQPAQEGMPDMQKMMKVMIYFSPLLMLVFFNNYASGLSLYYFVSNLITIGIMIVIKQYILDEDKIHATIQEKKKRPKKENRFQRKMKEMMEQAEQQKQQQKRKK